MPFFNVELDLLLFRIKLVSAILSFIFFVLTVHFMMQLNKLIGIKSQMAKLALKAPEKPAGANWSRWEEIMRHMDSSREAEWKFAIIEADKLVDDVLKSTGNIGETMGDRLMQMDKSQLESLDGLWEAHKIRNKLVHDVNYFLRYAEARRAIQFYEKALRELAGI